MLLDIARGCTSPSYTLSAPGLGCVHLGCGGQVKRLITRPRTTSPGKRDIACALSGEKSLKSLNFIENEFMNN